MGNWSPKPPAPVASPAPATVLKDCPSCGYDVPLKHFRRINGPSQTQRCLSCNHLKLRSAHTRLKLNRLRLKIRNNALSYKAVIKSLNRLQRFSYEANDRLQYAIDKINRTDKSSHELYKWVRYIQDDFHLITPTDPQWDKLIQFQKLIENE